MPGEAALAAKTGGGDGSRTHVRTTSSPKRYMLSPRLYLSAASKAQYNWQVGFVILVCYATKKPHTQVLSG